MTTVRSDRRERLLKLIPGGAHTYSRGFDVYPANAPDLMARGSGCRAWDADGREFIDLGMALASVNIGYAEQEIDEAAIEQIRRGNTASRPSKIELEAAERFVEVIDSADMVKFTKNGSTAVTAAVKLARAHTGRIRIARCRQHPFFSYDDWFIGSTQITRGIPDETIQNTVLFDYNDLPSLEQLVKSHPNDIACVVMEPVTTMIPDGLDVKDDGVLPLLCRSDLEQNNHHFVHDVQAFCRDHGIVFILDEMLTGFRWNLHGAQRMLGLEPDLCTFGKAMANGYSVACVGGRREIMEQGSIEFEGRERVFLLSTTHGAEMSSLGAFVATTRFIEREPVTEGLWDKGERLVRLFRQKAAEAGVADHVIAGGQACRPGFMVLDQEAKPCQGLLSLLMQEMITEGVLPGGMNVCHRLDEEAYERIGAALDKAMPVLAQGVRDGFDSLLRGSPVKPVFRRYN